MDEFDDAFVDTAATDLIAAVDAVESSRSANEHLSTTEPSLASRPQQQQQPVKQPAPQKVVRRTGGSIIVSPKQKGNPILNYIKGVPWEYGDIVPDYVVGESNCILFLSLKYHKLHPDYIYGRIRKLGNAYNLRILLIHVDIPDHTSPLRELTKTSVVSNLTNILAWTPQEAARYLEYFKRLEHAGPKEIQGRMPEDYASQVQNFFTQIRSVNKTDALNLVTNFGSVRAAVNAEPEEIRMIPGFGQQKVKRFQTAMNDAFTVRGRQETVMRKTPPPTTKRPLASANPAVAARLGIGPVQPIRLDDSLADSGIPWDSDDDKEAFRELETAERASVAPSSSHNQSHQSNSVARIMGALEDMRENKI